MATYQGSCHCGAVTYEVETDLTQVLVCNCSHCHKKGLLLNFVDKEKFALKTGADHLVEYNFNKKAIRHYFCKGCGVQAHAEGVSFPKACVNVRCLDGVDVEKLTLTPFNGKEL